MKAQARGRKHHKKAPPPPLPSDDVIARLSDTILRQYQTKLRKQKYARVKEILTLLGKGVFLSAAILAPQSAAGIAPLFKSHPDWDTWKHYNVSYLRRTLKQLEKQKQVEITLLNGQPIVQLTQSGKRKILKYSLDHLAIEPPTQWDGYWRLVLYDIPTDEGRTRDALHDALQAIGFYQIQKSVYLFPYSCFNEIEFVRQYFGVGNRLQYMKVMSIEHDEAYKTYFNLS